MAATGAQDETRFAQLGSGCHVQVAGAASSVLRDLRLVGPS